MGTVAVVAWLLIEPGFEPLVAVFGAFSIILGYVGWRSLRQKESLDKIVAALVVTGSLVGIIFLVVEEHTRTAPPNVEVAFFKVSEDGSLRLVDSQGVEIEVTMEDLLDGVVRIHINLAVKNTDRQTLEVTRVELTYEEGLEVQSAGRAKIDPQDRSIVYEHDIGTLERNIDLYTPLEALDKVIVPFNHYLIDTIALTKDGVPVLTTVAMGSAEGTLYSEVVITVGVRIYSRGRQPLEGQINFILPPFVEFEIYG